MSVTVLMATYNAGELLQDQLLSILHQTRRPDVIEVFDDGSTDGTVEYMRSIAESSESSVTIRLSVNSSNLGWRENFHRGILKCSGDFVFFSDQDDVWKSNKIERYLSVFESDLNVNVIVSPFDVIFDRSLAPVEEMDAGYQHLGPPGTFSESRLRIGAGCTIAVRQSYVEKLRPYYVEGLAHDYFFRQAAYFDGSLAVMEDASIYRRLHGSNASEGKRTLHESIVNCAESAILSKTIREYGIDSGEIDEDRVLYLKRIEEAFVQRTLFLEERKVFSLLRAVKGYPAMYRPVRHLFGDIALASGLFRRPRKP